MDEELFSFEENQNDKENTKKTTKSNTPKSNTKKSINDNNSIGIASKESKRAKTSSGKTEIENEEDDEEDELNHKKRNEDEELFNMDDNPSKTKGNKNAGNNHNKKLEAVNGIIDQSVYENLPMFIAFANGAKVFQKLLEYLESDFPEIDITFSENGISIQAADNAEVSLASVRIQNEPHIFEVYKCEQTYSITLNTKCFASKFRKPESFNNVCFVFARENSDRLIICMTNISLGLVDCTVMFGNTTKPIGEFKSDQLNRIRQIEFDTKILSTAIGRFKDISKMIKIGCDYKEFVITSSGGTKHHISASYKTIIFDLTQEQNGNKVIVKACREDSKDSKHGSHSVKKLNINLTKMINNIEKNKNSEKIGDLFIDNELNDQSKNSENNNTISKTIEENHYPLEYLTNILKISDLSEKVSIGFTKEGGIFLRFTLLIGTLTFGLSPGQE
jgi:hypothetical protein